METERTKGTRFSDVYAKCIQCYHIVGCCCNIVGRWYIRINCNRCDGGYSTPAGADLRKVFFIKVCVCKSPFVSWDYLKLGIHTCYGTQLPLFSELKDFPSSPCLVNRPKIYMPQHHVWISFKNVSGNVCIS